MSQKYYRGYILFRLSKIGTEWLVVDKMMQMKSNDEGKSWKVTYCTPIYGAWDLIAEVSFTQLEHLDTVVSKIRQDPDVNDFIEETTTLVSSKANYPLN